MTENIKRKSELGVQEAKKNLDPEELKKIREKHIDKLDEGYSKENVHYNFYKPDLLKKILDELDKTHKLDDKEKIGLFLIRTSAELLNPEDHKSAAIKGDSSSGKDNIIKTVLSHFPEEDNFFLTRTTTAALERECSKAKAIAFSEINAHRENGANSDLTETFKQMAEGGINVKLMSPDRITVQEIKSEQKTLFYGTTETETDDELETRYVVIPIRSGAEKNKVVCDYFMDSLINPIDPEKKESWVAQSIRNLERKPVLIPYASFLKGEISYEEEGEKKKFYLFDYTKERIKRDIKRLFSLTKAVTWIYQKQRISKKINGIDCFISEPQDFLIAMSIFADFFNLSYSGLDHRLQKCYEKIIELQGKHDAEIMAYGFEKKYYGYVLRHRLMEELGIQSQNTMKKRIDSLVDLGYIEDKHYDPSVPRAFLIKGINQGVNRVSEGVNNKKLIAIDTHLIPSLTPSFLKNWYNSKKIDEIMGKYQNITPYFSKLTPSKLTPSISPEIVCVSEEKENKITEEKVVNPLSKPDILEEIKKQGSVEIQDLVKQFGDEEQINDRIQKLKDKGDIFESPAGVVKPI